MSDWLAIFEGAAFALTVKGDMYKFFSKVFEGVDGIAIETVINEVRCFNAKRTAKAMKEIYERLNHAGIEPKKVPIKTLIPILENISIEEDETLSEKWSNLLESSIKGTFIHPSYIDLLEKISPNDAKVLDIIFKQSEIKSIKDFSINRLISEVNIKAEMSKEDLIESLEILLNKSLINIDGVSKMPNLSLIDLNDTTAKLTTIGKKIMRLVTEKEDKNNKD
ncbi:Abi-alpha family protein [uncultured Nostoc sp.]|uniref:Abi-alpha family protein n=1 Tax=uncultured Nostoc sp. TaxID=340711 RepID=UPI0035C9B848